jgi:hypothetical protein
MALERITGFIFPYISRHFRPPCVILAAHDSQKALKNLDVAASRRPRASRITAKIGIRTVPGARRDHRATDLDTAPNG